MSEYNYLIPIILSLIIHKYLHGLLLGYNTKQLDFIHDEEDIFGNRIQMIMEGLDVRFGSRWLIPISLTVLGLIFSSYFSWALFYSHSYLRELIIILAGILSWKYVLTDIDLGTGATLYKERLILVTSFLLSIWYPSFLFLFLFISINYFKAWLHHHHLPIRIIQLSITYLLSLLLISIIDTFTSQDFAIHPFNASLGFIILILAVYATHYWIPAAKKIKLSSWKQNWIFHNQLHLIIASAYTWGWLRWIDEKRVLQFIAIVKPCNIPFQLITIFIEISVIVLLFDPVLSMGIITGIIGMHLLIFICTGILFWELILVNIFILVFLNIAEESLITSLFSVENFGMFIILTLIIPFISKTILRAKGLGWWDTSYAGRIHWELIGQSGKTYGLYNDYMDPHERLFGRMYGWFFIKKKIPYIHLGEVLNLELRNRIIASKGNPDKLDQICESFGKSYKDPQKEKLHDEYFLRFFEAIYANKRKHILPKYLSFLKPPGGQFYYWGDKQAYTGQEKIKTVEIYFREYFYENGNFISLLNEKVKTIEL